jgi:dihydrofolate reductase
MIKMILAVGINGEIGAENNLLWDLPKDLQIFKEKTEGDIVVLGKSTFYSLPSVNGLSNRENWVLSSSMEKHHPCEDVIVFDNSNDILHNMNLLKEAGDCRDVWIIGGSTIYRQFESLVEEIHITKVFHKFPQADTFYLPNLTGFMKDGDIIDVSSSRYAAEHAVYVKPHSKCFHYTELERR